MEVLEHHDRRARSGQLAHQRGGDLMWRRPARDELAELPSSGLGEVEEGAERTRGEKGVAGAPENARRLAERVAELAQQDGLPDPRLAADQHEPPGPLGGDG